MSEAMLSPHAQTLLAWLAIALPWLAGGTIALRAVLLRPSGDAAERPTARLALTASALSVLILVLLGLSAVFSGQAPGHQIPGRWFETHGIAASFSLTLDALSLPIAMLVALIGWISLKFSVNYLHREAGFHRFFLIMLLFLGAMLLLVLAGNALLAFFAWEWLGITSYLLIGYAWHRTQATGHALQAIVTNRIGDAGFLIGLGLAAWWCQSFEWTALAVHGSNAGFSGPLAALNATQSPAVTARFLVIGFVLAAMVKSAQLPFSSWLGRALEGPTPSSALFYGAVMVHAGVYLLLRLEPLLLQAPDVMHGLALAGLLTALYAWLIAQVQTDIKSALVYASLFQVGLMFLAIGLGGFTWAAWHLGLHASWRIGQFLLSPSWLQLTAQPPRPAPRWLTGQQWLYTSVLQRFWLDRLAAVLLIQPTRAIADDTRQFDIRIIDRVLGEPGKGEVAAANLPLIRGDGWAGRAALKLSTHFEALERHLCLQGQDGAGARLLHRLGNYVQTIEMLLEQPRYLLLSVMATFVVIL